MELNNYHCHTRRCMHAWGSDEEYVQYAIKAGIKQLGFSDHTPWRYNSSFIASMRMKEKQLDEYIASIEELQEKYKGQIDLLIGLECEYFEDYMSWLKETIQNKHIDYIILGNHYYKSDELRTYFGSPVNERLLIAYVDQVIDAIDTGLYSYVAHPDLVNYPTNTKVYIDQMHRLCAYAKEHDIPLEYNLLGVKEHRNYPNNVFWNIASEHKCKAIIGFDAHMPIHLSDTKLYYKALDYLNTLDVEIIKELPLRW